MKTRYFVSDRDGNNGDELFLIKGEYVNIDGSFYCIQGSTYELNYITKVEEMELTDFIADGRTKYELNGIRFVIIDVMPDYGYIKIQTDKYCSQYDILKSDGASSGGVWLIFSRNTESAKYHGSHIEEIKLVTTCEKCGNGEIQDIGLCSMCISENSKPQLMCEHNEIVYTSGQYVEAIEKEVPDAVNHPSHYTGAGIECIEAIKASMTPDALAGYLKGNVQKYLWRYEKKVNPVEDLKKARWYFDYLINELEQANV